MNFLQSHKIRGVLVSQGSWFGLIFLERNMALPMHWILFVELADCQNFLSQLRADEESKMADFGLWSPVFDDFFNFCNYEHFLPDYLFSIDTNYKKIFK